MTISSSEKQASTRLSNLARDTLVYTLGVEATCFLVAMPQGIGGSDKSSSLMIRQEAQLK